MCMNTPLVSVIIPVYKVEKYIRQALDSVMNQTYRNLQIILIDDGSPDQCGQICDEYAHKDSRITVIHKENGGVSSARNAGIDMAEGEWLYFMDPDDWIEIDAFEKIMKNVEETGTDMVFFAVERIEGKWRTSYSPLALIDNSLPHFFQSLGETNTFLSYACGGSMCQCIVRKDIIKHIRFNTTLVIGEDYLVRLQIYPKLSSFSYIPDVLYHYRKNDSSASTHSDWKRYLHDENNAYQLFCEVVKGSGYPPNASVAIHSNWLGLMYRLLDESVMENVAFRFREKRKMVDEFMNSDIYLECVDSYDFRLVPSYAKIILKFRNPGIIHLYFASWLRKIYRCVRSKHF